MPTKFKDIARMIDLSAVRADSDESEVRAAAEWALAYRCAAVFALPSFTPLLGGILAGEREVALGGVVGFPSGGSTTGSKLRETEELLGMGCSELDMVINIGFLRSGRLGDALADIRAVTAAAGGVPVKVILECHHLTEGQIVAACRLAEEGGAAFVKTGTGWAPTGATAHNVALLRSCVGDRLGVKAAGGVRDLATLLGLLRAGASRFGLGHSSAASILKECEESA